MEVYTFTLMQSANTLASAHLFVRGISNIPAVGPPVGLDPNIDNIVEYAS